MLWLQNFLTMEFYEGIIGKCYAYAQSHQNFSCFQRQSMEEDEDLIRL